MIEADGAPIMPLTDRRSFLRRAATFLAAGAAGTTTAIVAAPSALAAPAVQEDPAIIALGERIDPLPVAYRIAAQERVNARATAEANCSAVPDDLVCNEVYWAGCTDSERDVEGREILPPVIGDDKYARRPRRILHSESTKAAIARMEFESEIVPAGNPEGSVRSRSREGAAGACDATSLKPD